MTVNNTVPGPDEEITNLSSSPSNYSASSNSPPNHNEGSSTSQSFFGYDDPASVRDNQHKFVAENLTLKQNWQVFSGLQFDMSTPNESSYRYFHQQNNSLMPQRNFTSFAHNPQAEFTIYENPSLNNAQFLQQSLL